MVSDSAPRAFGSLLAWEDARVGFRMAVTGIPPTLRDSPMTERFHYSIDCEGGRKGISRSY